MLGACSRRRRADADSHADTDADSHADADSDTDSHADADSDTDPHADADADADADSHADPDADAHSGSRTVAFVQRGAFMRHAGAKGWRHAERSDHGRHADH
ncbi:MSCRAMM family adhesin SdrC [Paraburkholderia largidicola]|uniref:Uncharacterized protein n=1 Tax=Paraburkholderia largidicola TaxID=3014751 RepID=A0A7I8C0A1_9BURK|nr:MSCRAMM family adhesin SdrC [Paraburkholderia sp. PGU16]BCF94412.1 hypothetical protein PPGU16_74790 [Paraburkholderia sp. PGU16]